MGAEPAIQVVWGATTDRGLRRRANEDNYLAEAPVFLVADGMGGQEGGQEASRRAIGAFRPLAGRNVAAGDLEAAFEEATRQVAAISTKRAAAGTTLSGVAVVEQRGETYWMVLNIGDSRTYRFTSEGLEQVSVDHSAVQVLIDRGELDPRAAEHHPHRNVVTRAVGGGATGKPDYWLLPIAPGDRMMICSDGLTKELQPVEIARVLAEERAPQAAATRLMHEALLRGGHDNVTVVVVDAHRQADAEDDPTRPTDVDENTVPRAPGGGKSDVALPAG